MKYFSEQAKDVARAAFVAALQLEGIPCDGLFYEPIYRSSLFPLDPAEFPALSWGRERPFDDVYLPGVGKGCVSRGGLVPAPDFLGQQSDISAIVDAIHKVQANIEQLRDLDHKAIRNQRQSRADGRASGCRTQMQIAWAAKTGDLGFAFPKSRTK